MKSNVFKIIKKESDRQKDNIDLIASENICSENVMKATGSVLTNKYAEGYPGKRYYGGCEFVDEVETYAIDLCKKVFQCDHANVQPHSGSNANLAAYFSVLKPGDTIVAMKLSAGGHLTHGHKVNFSGKLYNFVHYGVSPENEQIDYNDIEALIAENNPKLVVAGASAYSRFIDFQKLADMAHNNGALFMVDMAHIAGLVAAGVHPSPIPFADIVTSTTHKTLRGPRGGLICCKAELAEKVDKAVMPGCQGGPLMHVIAAKAVAFEEALTDEFKVYQAQVLKNAQAMVKAFKELGYRIVSDGTDNHLFLVDLHSIEKTDDTMTGHEVDGKFVEEILQKCNIVVNRNMIPFDKKSPLTPSGIRIGTPSVTTRGMKEDDVVKVVHFIDEAIKNRNDDAFLKKLQEKVVGFCSKFDLY